MEPRTHLSIDRELCGTPQELAPGVAVVTLETTARMAADPRGLVHGGFVFGLADYAAMLAVNDPHVVLGESSVKFLRPVRSGERVVARAEVTHAQGKKREVLVRAWVGDVTVMEGTFACFVLDCHVLDREGR
jgi:uncharacterized protein (TIGR00369 family)